MLIINRLFDPVMGQVQGIVIAEVSYIGAPEIELTQGRTGYHIIKTLKISFENTL